MKKVIEKSQDNSNQNQYNTSLINIHIATAGKSIRMSVIAQILSFICYLVGTIILLFSFFKTIDGIVKGESIEKFTLSDPSMFFFLGGFIFVIISLSNMYRAGKLLETSNDIANNGIDRNEPPLSYNAPEVISQIFLGENSYEGGEKEIIQVEFADGVKGDIIHTTIYNPPTDMYYFNGKDNSSYRYEDFTLCAVSFHYNFTKGNIRTPKL